MDLVVDVDTHSFNILSLCSGVGALDLGVRLAVPSARTVCYAEIEAYCCEVLASRMEDEALDEAPIWTNLKTFDGRPWCGVVDCITGGYPCQPFSVAGLRRGADDPRHLWPHIARIIREVQPSRCFFENVSGHLTLGFREVRSELESMGYRVAAGLFTAAEIGATHKRERLFIMAHANGSGSGPGQPQFAERKSPNTGLNGPCTPDDGPLDHATGPRFGGRESGQGTQVWYEAWWRKLSGRRNDVANPSSTERGPRDEGSRCDVLGPDGHGQASGQSGECHGPLAHTNDTGPQGRGLRGHERANGLPAGPGCCPVAYPPGPGDLAGWVRVLSEYPSLAPATSNEEEAKFSLRGMVNGLANRVDRLRAIGNGVVPDVAALAWRTLERELAESSVAA